MDVHVSWSLVGLNRTAEAASRTNQTEDVARAGEARDAAEGELEAWFAANDGKYLSGGEPGRATFALDHLEDFRQFLTRLRQTYGLVAAGLGMDSKEADLALQVCQTRGSRVEVVWSPNHADEVRKSLLEDFVADFPVAGGPEALEKKISGISPGTLTEPDTYDYSHVLPQGHRDAGYSMSVLHLPWKDEEDPGSTHFDTILHHQGQEVGSVSSRVRDGALHIDNTTINGKLDPSGAFAHRGKRLGVSMYAATMAHSHHLLGAKRTLGGVHSTSASRTHQSLARDHGLDYRPVKIDDNPVGDKDANYGPYEYALKSELVKAENAPRDAPTATPEQPSASSVPQTFEQQFHAAAQAQERIDRTQAQRDEIQRGQLLGQVAQVLRMVQGQAPKLEELRQAAPEVYQAVKAMAQAVAQMAQGLRGDGESMRKAEEWLTRPPLVKGHYDKLLTDKGMKLRAVGADPFTPAQAVHGHDAWNHQSDCQDRGCDGCLTQQDKIHGSSTGWQHATDCTDKGCGGACTERSQLMPAEEGPWWSTDLPDRAAEIAALRNTPWHYPKENPPPSGHRWRVWDFTDMLPSVRSNSQYAGLRLEVHHNPHANTMKSVLLAPPSTSNRYRLPGHSFIYLSRPLRNSPGTSREHTVMGQKTIPLNSGDHWQRSSEISKKAMSPLMRERYGKIMDTVLQHVMANRKDVVKSEQLDKNLSSIPPGKPLPKTSLSNAKEYDYSHLLPENQRHMKLVVRDHGLAVGRKTDAHPHYTAHVLDDSGEAGSVQAHLYDGFVGRRHMEMHAPFGLVREYQGRGLGSAMYEALQAHGVQHGRVTHVTGGGHTNSAGKVHERLAARHGFRYRPGKGGEYNDRGPYRYAVKSMVEQFDLVKMALQPRIAGRRQTGENEWDYSHLLSPEHQNSFRLVVRDETNEDRPWLGDPCTMAYLFVKPGSEAAQRMGRNHLFQNEEELVGQVGATHLQNKGISVAREVSTASRIHPRLRGKGLGKALYSALYTHALALGRSRVYGSEHTQDAGRVHASLAREHGFEYDAEYSQGSPDGNPPLRGSYSYTLKNELSKIQSPPKFPGLGINDNRRETPIVEGQALTNKRKLTGTDDNRYVGLTLGRDVDGPPVHATSYVDASARNPEAVKQHEDFHHMIRRIENRFGQPSRQRVVEHLRNSIDPHDLKVAEEEAAHTYPGLDPTNPAHYEEVLAQTCSYVNGYKDRGSGFHLLGGRLMRKPFDRDRDRAIKRVWRAIQNAAKAIQPEHLTKAFSGLPLPRLNRRVNLRLPVGTWDATSGRIKIRKPDGSEVWHQAKVGLIASSSPATAGADFGNPTSARNPSG